MPFVTLVHGVSASNNSYWPEIYENMSIVKKSPWLPYSYDLHKNSRFGMSTSCDPQLIMSPKEMVDKIFKNKPINKYSPLTMILWLERFSKNAKNYISKAANIIKNENNYEFLRIYIDVIIQSSIGKFFTYKFKASILWEYYLLSKNKKVGEEALNNYLKARNAWNVAAVISKKYYLPDLTYGPQSWLRGRWDDRLPAINQDIDDMRSILIKNKNKYKKIKRDLELIDYIKNWNNDQNILVNHLPPKHYIKGENISLFCKLDINKKLSGYINFREVNQSKKWRRKKLIKSKDIYYSVIPKRFTNTQYPIQYYFEFTNKKYSSFSPGFNKFLSNQPYYLLRQKL